MSTTHEFAAAKINLTLEVLGRRLDGYHEIESLVMFARDVCDVVSIEPAETTAATVVSGPFASAIDGPNLIDTALRLAREAAPGLKPARVSMEKHLPVASGIGGGSADAAAVLRLLRSFDPAATANVDFAGICKQLGADVSVCFESRATFMTGIGEALTPVAMPSGIAAVIVNPLAAVPAKKTAAVFKTLAAPAIHDPIATKAAPSFASIDDVIDYAQASENSLESVARLLFPSVNMVLEALGNSKDCVLVRLSGAGPTCFALFRSAEPAVAAAQMLRTTHPDWWIKSTALL